MKKVRIIVHCLVRNEENFIWYSLKSVLPFVDKIMVWDTGSTDKTVDIIKTIKSKKINLHLVDVVDADQFTDVRNLMIKHPQTHQYDWLMILDGDEIWPSKAIRKVVKYIQSGPDTQAVFTRTINSVGDIYHKLPESAGRYQIKNKIGHLGLRFINLKKVPKLNANLPHGQEGFRSGNTFIQDLPRVDYVDTFYLHTTHLERSSQDKLTLKRSFKKKYEIGYRVPRRQLPEVIFQSHPTIVPNVSGHMSTITFLRSLLQTIPKRIRRSLNLFSKTGY